MLAAAAAKVTMSLVILPLGDSITEGVPTADGYRADLRAALAETGIAATYVGSRSSGAGAHEGWSGFTTEELIPRLRAVLASGARPDIVLLHIGTNDLGLGVPIGQAAANVRKMLEILHEHDRGRAGGRPPAARPTTVLLARIIRRRLLLGRDDQEVDRYNAHLAAVAAERRAAGQPVELVDMASALDVRADLDDALHPNPQGYRKMARAWAEAVKKVARAAAKAPPGRPDPPGPRPP